MDTAQLNLLLGIATLALQVITVGLIIALVLRKSVPSFADVVRPFAEHAYPIGFVLSLGAALVTIYYSNVLGFAPCDLCWWQRIALYPQVILFGVALWKKEYARLALIKLSIIGCVIALYHHALQMLPAGSLPCPSQGVSCAKITFVEFGYITYPLMAATLFAFLIVLLLARRTTDREASHVKV